MTLVQFHLESCVDMAPIIQILLTLTYAVLGDCYWGLLPRQLLGLTPTVGPLLHQRTSLDTLHAILQRHLDHLRLLNQNRHPIHTYNMNPDRNYNQLNFNDGFNPPLETSPINTDGFDAPSGFEQFDTSQIHANVTGGHSDPTPSPNDLHKDDKKENDKKPEEYPANTLDNNTWVVDDVASLATEKNFPKIEENSNIKSIINNKEIEENLPPKTNKIKRLDDPNNGGRDGGLKAKKIILVSPNNNGNNIYLQPNTGNAITPNTITLPISANQLTHNAVYVPSTSIQNNPLYELIDGEIVPISIAQANQNNPYYNSQMDLPTANQNPSYVLVYNNGPNGNTWPGTNIVSNSYQNIPVTRPSLGENTVYIATPRQGWYIVNGQKPSVIAIPNNVIPQAGNQHANENVDPNKNNNITMNQQLMAATNPLCCQNNMAQTNTEVNTPKELETGNVMVATPNEVGDQPPVMIANGLTSQDMQPALMISYKDNTHKNKSKGNNDFREGKDQRQEHQNEANIVYPDIDHR